jgi:hypothetical protein
LNVIQWMPNFTKYNEKLKDKLLPILPDYSSLAQLGGIEFWNAQKMGVENDTEDAMWGLNLQRLETIEYMGKRITNSCSRPELWLRSDLCRLQKLLTVPTT